MGLARSLNNQETGASIIIWEQTFPSLRLCTKNTWWALIERPYSCAPQAVGAVYDRPGFFVQSPSLQRRGGCAERSEGADGVARQLLLSCRATPPLRGGECPQD